MVASPISACCLSSSLFASALALLPFTFPLPLLPPLCIVRLSRVSSEPCRELPKMLKHCYLAWHPSKAIVRGLNEETALERRNVPAAQHQSCPRPPQRCPRPCCRCCTCEASTCEAAGMLQCTIQAQHTHRIVLLPGALPLLHRALSPGSRNMCAERVMRTHRCWRPSPFSKAVKPLSCVSILGFCSSSSQEDALPLPLPSARLRLLSSFLASISSCTVLASAQARAFSWAIARQLRLLNTQMCIHCHCPL